LAENVNNLPRKGILELKTFKDVNSIDWIKVALFGVLLAGLYYSTFSWLVIKDWSRDDYAHGYFIPFLALFIVWTKQGEFLKEPAKPSWFGFIALAPGLLFYWLGELSGEFFAIYFSFWLILIGLCWLNFGWEKLRTILFALVITISMFPLPHFLSDKLSFKLKLISTQLGIAIIHFYGLSAFREGNIIDLGFTRLEVVEACSGLRYLIPLIILGIVTAYFFKGAFWKKVIIVLSTLPLTIIINATRIALTGILYDIWGAKVAEGFFHGFSSWFIFLFAIGFLVFEMWILTLFGSNKSNASAPDTHKEKQTADKNSQSGDQSDTGTSEQSPLPAEQAQPAPNNFQKGTWQKAILRPPQFVTAVLLIGVSLVFSQGIEFREKIPINKSFDAFPLKVGTWSGKRQSMEQRFIDALDLSDYIIVDFQNGTGKGINFYAVYYETQSKGESIHSPTTCLPGSGWIYRQADKTNIPVSYQDGKFMPVKRAFMEKNGHKQLSYYWFPKGGRILTNAYQLKLFTFWDALTRQRTDGALVRLITPVYEDEQLSDAEKRLTAFTREIVPVLDEFLPK
jgi:EpsI family protein